MTLVYLYIKEVYKQTNKQTNDYNWDTNETYLGVYVLGLTNPAQVHPHSLGVLQALEQLLISSLADDAWFPHLLCAHIYFFFGRESNTAGTGTATYSSYVYFNVISDGGTHRDLKPKILLAPPLNSNT